MKMLCLPVLSLIFLPTLSARDLSRYRSFSLGMNLTTTLKQTGQELHHVDVLCEHPAVILYKISVISDQHAIEGLTDEDKVEPVSALYGVPTTIAPNAARATEHRFDIKQRPIASWTGSQYIVRLLGDPFAHDMELLLFSQQVNTEAEAGMIEARKLEAQGLKNRVNSEKRKKTISR